MGLGAVGQLLAIFMMSLCTEYYQFFLAQAVLLGVSMSFVTWPGVGVLGRHFPRRRGMAMGIVVGGSSMGGIIWPIMLDRMLLDGGGLGFPWTMRVIGFTMLPLLTIATASINEPKHSDSTPVPAETPKETPAANSDAVPPAMDTSTEGDDNGSLEPSEKKQHKTDISILKNKSFLLLCSGVSLAYLGLFGPFFFVSSYASLHHYGSDSMAFYLISILNAASLFGRVLPGLLADKYGHFNICALALFSSALTAFCWTAVKSLGGLIVFAMAYGFTSGVSMLVPTCCNRPSWADRTSTNQHLIGHYEPSGSLRG